MSQLEPGNWLDRYELGCPIATGGMASVWVARLKGSRGFENFVAVKTIRAEHASDEAFVNMFLDEAELVALRIAPPKSPPETPPQGRFPRNEQNHDRGHDRRVR